MNKTTHPYFIENGESRQETAALLTGTAREFDVPQDECAATQGGFRISQRLYDVLVDEGVFEAEEAEQATGDDVRADGRGVDARPQNPDADEDPDPEAEFEDPFEGDFEDENGDGTVEATDWEAYEYEDLKAAADERGLETVDRKKATLIAALQQHEAEQIEATKTTDADGGAGDNTESEED